MTACFGGECCGGVKFLVWIDKYGGVCSRLDLRCIGSNVVHNPIEKLKKLANSANIACTEEQILDIGLTAMRNTRDFETALADWDKKPAVQKTWDNFKTHFKEAQQQLKRIRGPTMQQAGYHHANHLVEQLRKDMDNQNMELLSILHTAIETQTTTEETQPSNISDNTPPPAQQVNNTTTSDMVQLEMLKIPCQLQNNNNNNNDNDGNNNNNNNRIRRRCETPDNATCPRPKTDKYCWTHGGCDHLSKDCKRQASGHQTTATFANRMGGSNAYCTPVPT